MALTHTTASPRRSRALVLALAGALALGACSDGKDGGGGESNDPNTLLQEGYTAHLAGDLETAEQRYQQLVEVDPQNAIGFYDLGVVAQHEGRADEAEQHYRKTLELNPDMTAAMFNLAILRSEAGANDEAVDLYKRVNELDPQAAGSHLNLGLLLQQMGRHEEAQAELNTAVILDPSLRARIGGAEQAPADEQPAADEAHD